MRRYFVRPSVQDSFVQGLMINVHLWYCNNFFLKYCRINIRFYYVLLFQEDFYIIMRDNLFCSDRRDVFQQPSVGEVFFFKYVLTEACARTLPGLSKNCLVYSHFLLQSQSEFGICIFLIHDLFCCIHFMHKNKKTLRRKPIHNCINFAKRKTEWAHFLFTHLQQRFAPYLHPFG